MKRIFSKLSDVKNKIKKMLTELVLLEETIYKKVYLDNRQRSLSDEYKDES